MTWGFIDTDMTAGYYSAALFESIAKHVGNSEVDDTILFWLAKTPAVYLGYHQYVEDEIHEDYCAANGIQVVRRVLGGGCGFCDEDQILFSIIASEGGGTVPTDIQGAYSRVLGGLITLSELLDGAGYDIDHVKGIIKRGFEDALGPEARRSMLTGEEIELAQRLNEKHKSREWIYRMDYERRRRRNKPQVH